MKNRLIFLPLSIILTLFSLLIIRVIPTDSIEKVSVFNHINTITFSIDKVKGGENIRGFPFPMISTPVTHNSSSLSDYCGFYNIIFYFILLHFILFIKRNRILV